MKKILLSFSAAAVAVAMVPMFAAFEAHVVNVTAKIENALSVPFDPISFGTVFPQEHLEKNLNISLSGSFMTEPDADDVEYMIRQKPKCGVTSESGTVLNGPTWTGHVVVEQDSGGYTYRVDCEQDKPVDLPSPLPEGQTYGVLPSLCPYLSKHGPDENDGDLNSFHQPFIIDGQGNIIWTEVDGRLAKSDTDLEDQDPGDTQDNWVIDLSVPCFGGYCAQDWLGYVRDESGNQNMTLEEAMSYTQPIENQHKVFGCNLWIEVTEVSRFSQNPTQ